LPCFKVRAAWLHHHNTIHNSYYTKVLYTIKNN
jgi:hypothetical protein